MSELSDLRARLESHLKHKGGLDASRHARLAADFIEPEVQRLEADRDAARKRADALEVSLAEQEAWSDAMEQRLQRSAGRVQHLLATRCGQCESNEEGPTDE